MLSGIPAKMLTVGRSTNCAELAGSALAYFVWRYGLQHSPRRAPVLAVLFTAPIIIRGLSPYQFTSAATPFSWIPFRALFDTDRVAAITIFLAKLFAYGTFVWLLRDTGSCIRYSRPYCTPTAETTYAPKHF